MIGKRESIVFQNSIWDLHIHTCMCPKASSEFAGMPVDKYIDGLIGIFKDYQDLKMISFTDHNKINTEVYKAFSDKKTGINLLIGIEVDVFLSVEDQKANKYKHVIFYFDNTKFDLDKHANKINEKLNCKAILLFDFLNFLITDIKVPFLISPHFLKQGKRGVDYDWDEEATKKNIDKYIDQMCCFWEASNNSNIQRAIDLLKEFDKGDRVSVISFSDSNNYRKLKDYLDNPCQYFNSLPTFNGLRLAGTDCRRISFVKKQFTKDDMALCLGKIKQGENNFIYLSPGLNSIVGGRGSGKSLLLDGIAKYLDEEKVQNIFGNSSNDRIGYLNNLDYIVYDMNGNDLGTHDFKFDYFNQGYAQELFKKNNDLVSTEYFKDRFTALKKFNVDQIKSSILNEITCDSEEIIDVKNITSLDQKIVCIDDEREIKLGAKGPKAKELCYNDFEKQMDYLSKKSFIPAELNTNSKIISAKKDLLRTIYEETYKYNTNAIKSNSKYLIIDHYKSILKEHSDKKKDKEETIEQLKNQLKNNFLKINHRVKLMNKYLAASSKNFDDLDKNSSSGFGNRVFIFQRRLICQNLLDYLYNIFNMYFDAAKLKTYGINKKDNKDLFMLIEKYCYHCEEVILDSKSTNDLDDELEQLLSYKIEVIDQILVKDGEQKAIDLSCVSPGTRANFLLEYIVFNKSNTPLLIDQPEDNIDNETIFNQLTNWFSNLKKKRQVIVVTHDANIVVNSDSENVITCNQAANDTFDYKCGALEYGKTLDDVSMLLDGGREAIERRLLKYGE